MALFGVIKGGVKQLYNVGLSDMTGATSSADGANGLVPAPQAGDEDKVLRGDGTWGTAGGTATVKYDETDDSIYLMRNGVWTFWTIAGLAYPVGSELTFEYSGDYEEVTIPATGLWKLEVWGAEGGASHGGTYPNNSTAKGGHSVGYKMLNALDKLYVCVGGHSTDANAGYNGGNDGWAGIDGSGGATHIASAFHGTGVLKDYENYISDILIVAGGAGSTGRWYNSPNAIGSGGGLTGNEGATAYMSGAGGTQSAGGTSTQSGSQYVGSFGQGGGQAGNGTAPGGGGFYGGGAGQYSSTDAVGHGGGGSGYIDGVPSITVGGNTYSPSTENGIRSGHGLAKLTYLGR